VCALNRPRHVLLQSHDFARRHNTNKVIGRPFTSVEGGQGTWQSEVVAHEDDVFVIPPEAGLDDTSLAQFYVNPVTAYGMY
jgi:NADPH:quinone reductase-like Zn-dependent oxidoreductase